MMSEKTPYVLVIDDEADIRHLLTMSLVQMGISVESAKDVAEAKKLLSENNYDFCLTDLKLPDGNGMELVELCSTNYPRMPIAVITAFGNTDIAVEAMKLGAFDFLTKPVELVQLRQLLRHAFTVAKSKSKNSPSDLLSIEYLVGTSKTITNFNTQLERATNSNAPVVIMGQKGTEKEKIAKHVHCLGSNKDFTESYLDCSTLEQSQSELLLLGSENNILKQSNQSSLIISNIQCLSNHSQKRLQQVLESKTLLIENNEEEISVDVRIIVCTRDPLEEYVNDGSLREDLYFRLNVFYLEIPPINSRAEDFSQLLNVYLTEHGANKSLSVEARDKLVEYKFPFNYRELENIIRKASLKTESDIIELDDLSIPSKGLVSSNTKNGELVSRRGDLTLDQYIEHIETLEIRKALDETHWNRTEAAKILGISFRTIRYKIKKLNIE